jgi:PAP_fibrillin
MLCRMAPRKHRRHGPILCAETVSTTTAIISSDSAATTTTTTTSLAASELSNDQDATSISTTLTSPLPTPLLSKQRSLPELKQELLDLLPRLTGQAAEYRTVEQLVNAMESHDEYVAPQTLPFFTLATQGSWQLLFSTQLLAGGGSLFNPRKFRLREMIQIIHENDHAIETARSESLGTITGNVTNRVVWDWAQSELGVFDCTGTFSVECTSSMSPTVSGARMALTLTDHVLRLGPGSAVPDNVPELVAHVRRSMPVELFDPSHHAMDTTYLDGTVRIVRYTGSARLEGVRDIFVRTTAGPSSPKLVPPP